MPTESYSCPALNPNKGHASKNLVQLCCFIKASNLLDNNCFDVHRSDHKGRFLQTIQLVFAHWQFDLSVRSQVNGFGYSQQIVYSHPNKVLLFLDKRGTINIEYLLHVLNFFKHHMTSEQEGILHPWLQELEKWKRPGAWERPLSQSLSVKMLKPSWKGSYGTLANLSPFPLKRLTVYRFCNSLPSHSRRSKLCQG